MSDAEAGATYRRQKERENGLARTPKVGVIREFSIVSMRSVRVVYFEMNLPAITAGTFLVPSNSRLSIFRPYSPLVSSRGKLGDRFLSVSLTFAPLLALKWKGSVSEILLKIHRKLTLTRQEFPF